MKAVKAKLSNGRVLILADSGQTDQENFDELNEICGNIMDNNIENVELGIVEIEEV